MPFFIIELIVSLHYQEELRNYLIGQGYKWAFSTGNSDFFHCTLNILKTLKG
jgi:hypothetical protein